MNLKVEIALERDRYNLIDADGKCGDDYYIKQLSKSEVFELLRSIVDSLQKG